LNESIILLPNISENGKENSPEKVLTIMKTSSKWMDNNAKSIPKDLGEGEDFDAEDDSNNFIEVEDLFNKPPQFDYDNKEKKSINENELINNTGSLVLGTSSKLGNTLPKVLSEPKFPLLSKIDQINKKIEVIEEKIKKMEYERIAESNSNFEYQKGVVGETNSSSRKTLEFNSLKKDEKSNENITKTSNVNIQDGPNSFRKLCGSKFQKDLKVVITGHLHTKNNSETKFGLFQDGSKDEIHVKTRLTKEQIKKNTNT